MQHGLPGAMMGAADRGENAKVAFTAEAAAHPALTKVV